MQLPDIIGFIGVFLILTGFLLNLTNIISYKSQYYILLNFIGAGMACYASVLLKYVPFIILEATWAFVSLVALINIYKKKFF